MRNFTLTQLIKPDVLQQIQDAFSDYTGMAALTTDAAGVPVTKGSNFTRFCTEVIRTSPKGCSECEKCDKNGALIALNDKKPAIYRCHAGLVDFAAPIMVSDKMIGSFVAGQVLTEELDEELCRKKALEYGIDPEEFISAAKKATRMSHEQVEKSAKLLFDISKALSSLALRSFNEIEKSRSLEVAARSQSDHIMGVFSEVANMDETYLRAAKEALESDDREKMKETLQNIVHYGASASGRIRDSITYLKTIGKKFRMSDEEYRPNKVLTSTIDNIRKKLPEDVSLSLELSDDLPDLLLGDAGCMCQLVDKLIQISTESGGRRIHLSVRSSKHCYAEVLHLKITADCPTVSGHDVNTINKIISAPEGYFPTSMDDFDISIVRSLLQTLSGSMVLFQTESDIEYRIDLPQLKIEGGAD